MRQPTDRPDILPVGHTDDLSGGGFKAGIGEGVLRNGVDTAASQRAHMRALVAARQAVERRYAARSREGGGAARTRALQMREELASIEAEHQAWLREHRPQE
jgi:hypothetical protein